MIICNKKEKALKNYIQQSQSSIKHNPKKILLTNYISS